MAGTLGQVTHTVMDLWPNGQYLQSGHVLSKLALTEFVDEFLSAR